MRIGSRQPRRRLRVVGILVAAAALGVVGWLALRVGPEPMIAIDTDRPAVGRATAVSARFLEPDTGLTDVRLEVVQGDRVELLGSETFTAGSWLPWFGDRGTVETVLAGTVGRDAQPWLAEGVATIRATAARATGFLRPSRTVVEEVRLPVRLTPPRLEVLSSQHYGRQGGSGAVRYRVGDTAIRSGVRAGTHESVGAPVPDGDASGRFVVYALPWNVDDPSEIRLFAEDDAGNRVEQPFLDIFKPRSPSTDRITITDAFLERVVPPIADRSPEIDASAPLIDQYLVINGELRRAELERVAELSRASAPSFLWSGPFVQMANSALRANFAQTRTYVYRGEVVDHQTHLGLDLASTARATVPAPNAGRVVAAGWMSLYGNAVVIDHGGGLLSLSGHMSSIDVADGELVERGQIIGRSGATGLAGGDHLHLEIFVHGQSVDPLEWLDGTWIENNITAKLSSQF
jgi:murein DD-endopeptidase MepM/ murein hydrolase activator NlpD